MRVAIVAPFVSVIDDRSPQLGGVQALVADLASGLAAAGHDVSLLAATGSHVRGADLVDLGIDARSLVPASLHQAAPRTDDAAQREAFGRARAWIDANAERIGVVHAHAYDAPAFDLLDGARPRVVHTLHLPPIDPAVVAAARRARARLATVSRANAGAWSAAGVAASDVVLNGIAIERVPVGRGAGGYLLAAGRIAPEKGIDAAARVARAVGMRLVVAGDVYDPGAHAAIDPTEVEFVGPRRREELFRLMGEARALLMPVRWDEPFGLVAVEAMAAGTPVVAYRRGGLAEVIADGVSGSLVDPGDEDAFARAVLRMGTIDRARCRAWVRERFTLGRMVAEYADLYARL